MEWAERLLVFCEKIHTDHRISPSHISLYLALLQEGRRQNNSIVNPGSIFIMQNAKISSRVTFGRRLRELHEYGYLVYSPSYIPGKSCVKMCMKQER